jgi:N-acetylglucosaminyldiphosphoundecaprenol N-acetyl-beta-D-mannosaminyltransferase
VRIDVLGMPVSATSYTEVVDLIGCRPTDRAYVVAVCNVHSVMSARRDPQLRAAIIRADLATSDGMPLVWYLRLMGRAEQTRVYGPDLMRVSLRAGVARGWTHYLYGTTETTLDRLEEGIASYAPGARIAGRYAPPYRPLSRPEEDAVVADITSSGADIVWVGLGMPRQELFMHRIAPRLPGVALIGVGAAFDLISGTIPQAPPWLQRMGLEWLFRLWQEPRRLWRRYIINNPLFAVVAASQIIRYRVQRRIHPRGVAE